jgi:hypothetical protein
LNGDSQFRFKLKNRAFEGVCQQPRALSKPKFRVDFPKFH